MPTTEIGRLISTVAVVQFACDWIAYWCVFRQEPYQRSLASLIRSKQKLEREKQAAEAAQVAEASNIHGINNNNNNSNSAGKKKVTSSSSNNKKQANNHNNSNPALSSAKSSEKWAKRLQRAQGDYDDSLANVARQHTIPGILTSVIFVLLMRVLGAELRGRIVAMLPFVPYRWLHKVTGRGLEFVATGQDVTSLWEPNNKVGDLKQAAAFMFCYALTAISVKFYVHKLSGTHPPKGAEGIFSILSSPSGQKLLRSVGIDPADLKIE